ncbi:MAG: hypothetical protein R3183_14355 [Oleiphilaceae bacterium]|nr:hypothetical protein [Oleiphilaceae bacterium]
MKLLILLVCSVCFWASAWAEEGSDTTSEEETSFFDQFSFENDADPFNMRGLSPRYAYVHDENLIGHTHYGGIAYFERHGAAWEGPSLRAGFGSRGEKINLAYTDGFSFFQVDLGLSYYFLDSDNPRDLEELELLGLELGLRMWVVQIIGVHTEETSFVSLAFGF